MFLICHNGEVLHFNGNFYYTRPANSIDYENMVDVDFFDKYNDFLKEDLYIYHDNFPELDCEFDIIGKAKGIYNNNTRAISFRNKEKKYLCLDNGVLSFSRDEANLWESFLPIDEKFFEKINHLFSNKWISKRTGQLFDGKQITFSNDFSLNIGNFSLDLRSQNIIDFKKYKFIGFHDSWKIEVFLLYNPLIYITAYSSKNVLSQLGLCVRSLRNFSNFGGKIVVMSDKDISVIREICQDDGISAIEVDNVNPKDFVGYVCSKFSLTNKNKYIGYQPIMYLDPDIIFSGDVNTILQEATLTEDICAPLEDFHRIQTHIPVGAGLIQLDALITSPYAAGFNGGTIVYPNVEEVKVIEFLNAARRTVTNIGEIFGRNFNAWADQEVINYLSVKFFNLNTSCLTKYAKYINKEIANIGDAAEFVHFWGHNSDTKVHLMNIYFNKIETMRKNDVL